VKNLKYRSMKIRIQLWVGEKRRGRERGSKYRRGGRRKHADAAGSYHR
jgi:hypothetical protein